MKKYKNIPSPENLIIPCFNALKQLGGSGTINEIYNKVVENLKLSETELSIMQTETGSQTKVAYNLAWARTYLKKFGAINNPMRSIWEISNNFKDIMFTKEDVINNKIGYINRQKCDQQKNKSFDLSLKSCDVIEELTPWNDRLMQVLYKMNPYSFEKLAQLILRKIGLDQVVITKKSNDGGVDGYGVFRLNGIISFNIAFQCKRYKGSVSAAAVRDFRGSITADIEKALMITTGTYTQDAKKEASSAGKIKIDLIDGNELVEKLVELRIGIKESNTYIVDEEFFLNF